MSKNKKHHGITLFNQNDLNAINEYRANRAIREHSAAQSAAFCGTLLFFGAGFCVFELPKEFLGFHDVNLWCGLVCLILAVICGLIHRVSSFHIDPTDNIK